MIWVSAGIPYLQWDQWQRSKSHEDQVEGMIHDI
jgi:hypothetical protein